VSGNSAVAVRAGLREALAPSRLFHLLPVAHTLAKVTAFNSRARLVLRRLLKLLQLPQTSITGINHLCRWTPHRKKPSAFAGGVFARLLKTSHQLLEWRREPSDGLAHMRQKGQ
jgi:hypothetical protein